MCSLLHLIRIKLIVNYAMFSIISFWRDSTLLSFFHYFQYFILIFVPQLYSVPDYLVMTEVYMSDDQRLNIFILSLSSCYQFIGPFDCFEICNCSVLAKYLITMIFYVLGEKLFIWIPNSHRFCLWSFCLVFQSILRIINVCFFRL